MHDFEAVNMVTFLWNKKDKFLLGRRSTIGSEQYCKTIFEGKNVKTIYVLADRDGHPLTTQLFKVLVFRNY